MLFNSYQFLFGFLPAAVLIYSLADPYPKVRLSALVALSLVFYGYWNPLYLALLVPSILVNWQAARLYVATGCHSVITGAIAVNLAVLGVFKYQNFIGQTLSDATGLAIIHVDLALPLGISFFTFHHIMYLVDLRRGIAPLYPLDRYALYICFFPQVLSGPLVRWSEVMDQFGRRAFSAGWEPRCASGVVLIVLGLLQKTTLGDPLALIANSTFEEAARTPLGASEALVGILAFGFQIFFDFSGYSDVAIGTALILGIELPRNFDGPYRASSIRDFWRRWHMTLSRFLRDYLYIPLGGNRSGLPRQAAAIAITMALGGLWHGAGWSFIVWGLLHGVALIIAVIWSKYLPPLPTIVGWTLTFVFVMLTWTFFRANSLGTAWSLLESVLTANPGRSPSGWRIVAVATACAILLPPSHVLSKLLTANPRTAFAVALSFCGAAVVIALGTDQNYEFVYFQF